MSDDAALAMVRVAGRLVEQLPAVERAWDAASARGPSDSETDDFLAFRVEWKDAVWCLDDLEVASGNGSLPPRARAAYESVLRAVGDRHGAIDRLDLHPLTDRVRSRAVAALARAP